MNPSYFVEVVIWEAINPNDRTERYEEPLQQALETNGIGEVTGGGSLMHPNGEIKHVNIDLEINDFERAIPIIKNTLTLAGAPKGSEIKYGIDESINLVGFGETECLAIYLDGVGLPSSVYESSDINDLADLIWSAISELRYKEIRSSWQGPSETALYLFSDNADDLEKLVTPVLNSYPLCQNARIVVRHGAPTLSSRETRIAMWPQS